MADFTPGPWHFHADERYAEEAEVRCAEGILAVLVREDGFEPEDTATGILMAAAPDLLTACEAVVKDYEFAAGGRELTKVYAATHAVMKAVAAIAKARGKAVPS